ncbi:MAG: hypothetical protein AAF696_16140 [Bacteroidota bacterium]
MFAEFHRNTIEPEEVSIHYIKGGSGPPYCSWMYIRNLMWCGITPTWPEKFSLMSEE